MKLVSAENLIDELLAEQQSLTAVERFSQFHEQANSPSLENHYRNLIPLSRPSEGEQYSFEVDLDACSGCKACVTACHSLNGLDEGESWRDVGSLVTTNKAPATQQTVTSACHHCADPACANGCPTLAYDKDAETGVVRHLDDQCIGCQYCTMTCPYDVPKYNDRLGIVRKCDMCQSRLREGEAPACVQACPNEAIKIRIVPVESFAVAKTSARSILPGTAPSFITQPSTKYLNLKLPEGDVPVPANHDDLTPSHRHTPLVLMLVLTQVAAGLLLFDFLARFALPSLAAPGIWHAIAGTMIAFAGLAGATLHLGRPLQAWRSFLGWRKSWLSREILVFGAWSGAAMSYVAALLFPLPEPLLFIKGAMGAAAAGSGLLGVFCSIMVYVFTKRPYWAMSQTGTRFGLTLVAAGGVFTLPLVSCLALATKLFVEFRSHSLTSSPFTHTAKVVHGPLRKTWIARIGLGIASVALLVGSVLFPPLAFVAFPLLIAGEFLARGIYFQAVHHPKMPGGITGS